MHTFDGGEPGARGGRTEPGAWPLVSVLFVTYKRVDLLERCISNFRAHTEYPNLQLVIADDGSGPEIQAAIRKLPANVYALAEKNAGLGANANQGIRACDGKYILMLQDDWIAAGPPAYLRESVLMMEANPHVGLINYAGGPNIPDYSMPLAGSTEPCFVTHELHPDDPFSALYSDQPHMHRKAALDFVGPYRENCKMELCERDYEARWAAQTQYVTAEFPGYFLKVFHNQGTEHSHRTNRLTNRIDAKLLPIANWLMKRSPTLFKLGKTVVRAAGSVVEKVVGAR